MVRVWLKVEQGIPLSLCGSTRSLFDFKILPNKGLVIYLVPFVACGPTALTHCHFVFYIQSYIGKYIKTMTVEKGNLTDKKGLSLFHIFTTSRKWKAYWCTRNGLIEKGKHMCNHKDICEGVESWKKMAK